MQKGLGLLATTALLAACGTKNTPNNDSGKQADNATGQTDVVRCYGINGCNSYAQCAVTAADLEATKSVFGDKFASTELHECKGLAKCAAEKGQLNWVQVSRQECGSKGGFLIDTKADGGKIVTKL